MTETSYDVNSSIRLTPELKKFVDENSINVSKLTRKTLENLKEKMNDSQSPNLESSKVTRENNSKEGSTSNKEEVSTL